MNLLIFYFSSNFVYNVANHRRQKAEGRAELYLGMEALPARERERGGRAAAGGGLGGGRAAPHGRSLVATESFHRGSR